MSNADIRGRFIWHELVTTDPDAAAAFYSKVVPWKTQDSGMPSYRLWMAGQTRVGGLTGSPEDASADTPPHWIIYIATPDVDATVAAAERLGGKVIKPGIDIPNNMGRFAVLTDPQGATFAVYTPPAGPAPEGSGAVDGPGDFGWHELATTDHAAALRFYSELFGWEKGPGHDMGQMGTYQLVVHHGQQIGGLYTAPGSATPPSWLPYIRVADCSKATNIAKGAGGRVLNGPMQVPGGTWISQLMDPQGGAFAVMEPAPVEAQKPAAKPAAPKPAAPKPAAPKKRAAAKADAPAAVSQPEAASAAPAEAAPAAASKPVGKPAKKPAKRSKATASKKKGVKPAAAKKAAKKAVKKAAGKATRKAVKKAAAKKAAPKAAPKAAKGAGAGRRSKAAAKKSAGKAKRGGKKAKRR